jgi:hypothetical protein
MTTKNRFKTVLTLAVVAVALTAVTANATVTISAGDWNTAGNWDSGVPSGTDSATISAGHAMTVSAAAPTYSGGLTMGNGSSLMINDQGLNVVDAANAIGTGTITMNNSTLDVKTRGTVSFGAIALVGDGTITATANSGDDRTRNLTGIISGTGAFTIFGRNKQPWNWQQTNTFSGGLNLNAIDRHVIIFNAAGSAGTGDVTVSPRPSDARSAVIKLGANDVFAPTATLTLNGQGWNGSSGYAYALKYTRLDMQGFNATVGALIIDDVAMPYGDYTGTADTADWIDGTGTLTVKAADPNLPDVDAGPDMISWSGQAVALDPNVVNNDTNEPQGTLTYLWTASPDGIGDPNLDVAITDADQEDASVTITKTATGDATVVTMTLAVTLPGKDPVKDSMTIDVYDDACLAALDLGLAVIDPTDLDENCITNFADFAVLAATWLDDYALTGPVAK